jgi:acyl-CoA synthetase (AMP-forming)/AMP-acid ligase II
VLLTANPARYLDVVTTGARAVPTVIRGDLLPPAGLLPRTVGALLRNGSTLALLAELSAARFPDRPAVIDEFGEISFAELHRRSSRIAGALHDRYRIDASSTVAVLAGNHRHFVEALVACSRLGAELVFLNTELTGYQLSRILDRHRPDLVIADDCFDSDLSGIPGFPRITALTGTNTSGRQHDVGTLDELVAADAPAPPRARRQGALTLLTSGTTGLAKGAPRRTTLAGALSTAGTALPVLSPTTDEVIYAAPPFFHGFGLGLVVAGLGLGATVVTRRRFDAAALLGDIERHRVTLLPGVPTMLQRLLDLPPEQLAARDTSSVRLVLTGAAPISAQLCRRIMNRFGPVLVNIYGSTELGPVSVAGPADLSTAPGTVGRPFAGVSVRILRPDRTSVGPGEIGTIFVSGPMQFGGYSGTADKAKEVVDGHLNAGDLGRFDTEGRLFLVGRDDDMIVSGGENIFSSEVEDVLAAHPCVHEAAVVGVRDNELGNRVRAFVVLNSGVHGGTEPSLPELKEFTRSRIERYKAPREVAFLDELPRNATGKVLRVRLRELPEIELRFARETT